MIRTGKEKKVDWKQHIREMYENYFDSKNFSNWNNVADEDKSELDICITYSWFMSIEQAKGKKMITLKLMQKD